MKSKNTLAIDIEQATNFIKRFDQNCRVTFQTFPDNG